MLDRDIEWTERLGRAGEEQSDELMQAITQFRNEAHQSGNLQTDSYQIVSVDDDQVTIRHKNKEKIYVPYYDHKKVTKRQSRTCITTIQMHIPFTTIPTNQVITLIGLSMESTLYLDCPGANTGSAVIRTLISYILITEGLTTNHFRRSQIFPGLQKKRWVRARNREREDQTGTNPMIELLTLGDKNQTAHQKTLIDRERARNQTNS